MGMKGHIFRLRGGVVWAPGNPSSARNLSVSRRSRETWGHAAAFVAGQPFTATMGTAAIGCALLSLLSAPVPSPPLIRSGNTFQALCFIFGEEGREKTIFHRA